MKRINTLTLSFAVEDYLRNFYDVLADSESFRRIQSVFQGRYLEYRHIL